jgi:hypothetical protein
VAELEGLFARYVARPEYAREVMARHRGPLNTDDRNLLEFGFARSVNRHDLFDMKTALELSKKRGFDRPPVAADLDWDTVEDARALLYAGTAARGEDAGDPLEFYGLLFDRALKAAASGRPIPPEQVSKLREIAPEVADVLEASLSYRGRDPDRALELLTGVFQRLRTDPWPEADVMYTAIKMLGHMAVQDRKVAEPVLALLREPFASRVLDEQRLETAFQIATHHRMPEACVAFLAGLEPWPPWRKTLLERRVTCYEIAESPKFDRARVELAEFMANE